MSDKPPWQEPGAIVTYEHLRTNSGRRYKCTVVEFVDGWVKDVNQGTCFSASFRPEEVMIVDVVLPKRKR